MRRLLSATLPPSTYKEAHAQLSARYAAQAKARDESYKEILWTWAESEDDILESFRALDHQERGTLSAIALQVVMRNYGDALSVSLPHASMRALAVL